jgi:hypothetical protein
MRAQAATEAHANDRLREVEGFRVESPDGELGWVEEIWVGNDDEPCALAIQTTNGRHALVLGNEVVAVHRDRHWLVVVPRAAALRELAPPHVVTSDEDDPARRPRMWRRGAARPQPQHAAAEIGGERPLWKIVALLYLSIAAFVALLIGFVFLVAWLVTGTTY